MKKGSNKLKGILIALIALLMVVAIGLVAFIILSKKMSYDDRINRANRYIDDEEYEDAIDAFDNAIEINSLDAKAYVGIADAYMALDNQKAAKKVLKRAINDLLDEKNLFNGSNIDKQVGILEAKLDEIENGKDKSGDENDSEDESNEESGSDNEESEESDVKSKDEESDETVNDSEDASEETAEEAQESSSEQTITKGDFRKLYKELVKQLKEESDGGFKLEEAYVVECELNKEVWMPECKGLSTEGYVNSMHVDIDDDGIDEALAVTYDGVSKTELIIFKLMGEEFVPVAKVEGEFSGGPKTAEVYWGYANIDDTAYIVYRQEGCANVISDGEIGLTMIYKYEDRSLTEVFSGLVSGTDFSGKDDLYNDCEEKLEKLGFTNTANSIKVKKSGKPPKNHLMTMSDSDNIQKIVIMTSVHSGNLGKLDKEWDYNNFVKTGYVGKVWYTFSENEDAINNIILK